jgi:hypothetical protein
MDLPLTEYVEMTDTSKKRAHFQLPVGTVKDSGTLSRTKNTLARKSWRSLKSLYRGARVDTGFNEALFQVGLFTFLFSYIVVNVFLRTLGDRSGWSLLVFALLQTAGMITISMADVDINQFLEHNRHQAYAFAAVWIANGALNAVTGQLYYVIDVAPVLYLLVRSNNVLGMHDG